MIVFLNAPHFYIRALGLERAPKAVIVVRARKVLDVNQLAMQAGAYEGMTINEAKAVLKKSPLGAEVGVQFIDHKLETFEAKSRVWLDRCTELSDVIEPVDQHQAYVDLSAHPKPLSLLPRLVEGFEYGIAQVKWLAKVAWRQKDGDHYAYEAPNFFLDSLPTACLPIEPAIAQRLDFLGYRTVGDVSRLGLKTLQAQFGNEAHHILSATLGRAGEPVQSMYPQGTIANRLCFESSVEDGQVLEHSLRKLSGRLGELMQRTEQQSSLIRVTLEFENGEQIQRERQCSKPIYSANGIISVAGQFLQIHQPVTALRIQLCELSKVDRKQNSLYVSRTESIDAVASSIKQVRKTFGTTVVRQGSEIPRTRRQELLRAWRNATGWS